MKTLTYFAFAKNADGKLEQLRVSRVQDGNRRVSSSQEWTGVIYKTPAEALEDTGRLNASARFETVAQ